MGQFETASRRRKRAAKPLDSGRLEELALAYVARFATTASKLEAYLARKLRERGWDGEGEPQLSALVERFVEKRFVDDAAYAQAKGEALLRRGYGPRRVKQALYAAGVDEDIARRSEGEEGEHRRAAIALARRRRLGPFSREAIDPPMREKQIAALVRAGHSFDVARAVVEAEDESELARWAEEADEDTL